MFKLWTFKIKIFNIEKHFEGVGELTQWFSVSAFPEDPSSCSQQPPGAPFQEEAVPSSGLQGQVHSCAHIQMQKHRHIYTLKQLLMPLSFISLLKF